jgi:hypothetical protein
VSDKRFFKLEITLFGFSAKKLTQEVKETIDGKNCERPEKMKQRKNKKVFFKVGV